MTRRRIPLEDRLGISPDVEDGADRLLRALRGGRKDPPEGEDAREGPPPDRGDVSAFSRAVRERAEAKRLGWDDLYPDGPEDAA